jgi:hypothetical protein
MENIFDSPATRDWIRQLSSEKNINGLYQMMYNNIHLYQNAFIEHSSEHKMKVLEKCLDYFTLKEDYEKCMRLIEIRKLCLKKT